MALTWVYLRLQWRNGFYAAAIFVAVVWIAILRFLPLDEFPQWVPLMIFANLQITTFYFAAGQVLLDIQEGTLPAQWLAGINHRRYCLALALSLGLLAGLENGLIVGLGTDLLLFDINLWFGIALLSALYVQSGLTLALQYQQVNEFLLPSMLAVTFLSLPLGPYLNLFHLPLLDLHPFTLGLKLLSGDLTGPFWLWTSSTIVWVVWMDRYLANRMANRVQQSV